MRFRDGTECCSDCGWAIDAEVEALKLFAWKAVRDRFLERRNLIIIDPRTLRELTPPVKQFPVRAAGGEGNVDPVDSVV